MRSRVGRNSFLDAGEAQGAGLRPARDSHGEYVGLKLNVLGATAERLCLDNPARLVHRRRVGRPSSQASKTPTRGGSRATCSRSAPQGVTSDAAPIDGATPAPSSSAELKAEIESLRRSLTEALEQQTATSEILDIISRSRTDVQPVFDTIVRSAEEPCVGCSARSSGSTANWSTSSPTTTSAPPRSTRCVAHGQRVRAGPAEPAGQFSIGPSCRSLTWSSIRSTASSGCPARWGIAAASTFSPGRSERLGLGGHLGAPMSNVPGARW